MKSSFYTSEAQFNNEMRNIKTPIFVCHTDKLVKEGDYVLFDYYGNKYIAQKSKKEISILENKCLHRNFPLKSNETGNEKLICPYHGWYYNYDGKLIGIPKKDCFKAIPKKKNLKKLVPEICGKFLFASNNKGDLKNHLGSFYNSLKNITLNTENCEFEKKIDYDANWKLCVENSIDEYHIVKVHPTNAGFFGFMKNYKYFDEKKNLILFSSTDKNRNLSYDKFKKNCNKNIFDYEGYKIFYVYPNLFLHIYFDYFYYTNFLMLSPNKTINRLAVFSFKDNKKSKKHLNKFINNYFLPSVYEDKKIIEDFHNHYSSNKKFTIKEYLSEYEQRIKNFRKNLINE
jgi:phenylpropionate dioxygenase-like ring-hydroxylating dioxygenase large terminal subunit